MFVKKKETTNTLQT